MPHEQTNTSTGWPPAGLVDGSSGPSTGWPPAGQPETANNLKVDNNTIASVSAGGGSAAIPNTALQVSATPTPQGVGFATSPVDLVYERTSGTLQGTSVLQLSAVDVDIGDMFTQKDINDSLMTWTPDASAQNDNLEFQVVDLEHGGVINVTVNFVST